MAFSLSRGPRGLRASILAAGVALSQTIALVMLTGCASQIGQNTQAVVEVLPAAQMVPTKLGRLAVRDSGPADATGDVLVLWHAVLTDHRIYQAQIEAWRGRHRLIVIDGPGHGGSQAAPGPFSMADCATALAETLDALNITQPVVIVGTSWGGLVGGEFALAYPARTRALVMLNTPINAPAEGLNFSDRFVVWGARWIHASSLYRDGVARAFFLPTTRAQGGPVMQAFHDHLRQADGPALALSVGSVLLEREALAPRMGGIRAPVLFIVGAEDNMYPPQTLRPAVAQLPQGRFEVVPSAHISVVDAPEATTRLINEFLARLPNRG
ncbi:MAG: alpha/beta fold hydrolase [Roseomonas sp.]|nr:alpha/beta fold hydrolase [Roseomonas sp.]